MAKSKTYDMTPKKSATTSLPGPASAMSQRQVYSQTGKVKTAAEAGAGKPSTPKTY